MKKLLLIIFLASNVIIACKKDKSITPIVQVQRVLKLGDTVRWISKDNPNPNDKMIIKALYYNDPLKPLSATALNGTVYLTKPVEEFILWK